MKSFVCRVLISGTAVAVSASGATLARTSAARSPAPLSQAQLAALVTADLNACDAAVPIVPAENLRSVSADRLRQTLHGVWRGRVAGDYPKELLAADGYLNVDYYWIIDTERGEALILEQLSSTRSAPATAGKDAPVWSFLTCGRAGYVPQHPKQIHEFQKISDSLDGARSMLELSTGLKHAEQDEFSLSAAWQRLVETKYFDTKRYGAYAGGLFKPFEITHSTDKAGNTVLSLSYQAEYRGAGQTAAHFEPGEPILGKESAGFVGVSTPDGEYLVSSSGNGVEWEKSDVEASNINMTMDKVVIGPLTK